MTTKIQILENGPYIVSGHLDITDAEGKPVECGSATVALCRCGGSSRKPFCDGTHSKISFQAAKRAAEEQDLAKDAEIAAPPHGR